MLFHYLGLVWMVVGCEIMWKLCENFHIIQLQLWPIPNDDFDSSPVFLINLRCMMLRKRYYEWFKCFADVEVKSKRDLGIEGRYYCRILYFYHDLSLFCVSFKTAGCEIMWKLCENFHIIQLRSLPISNDDFASYPALIINLTSVMLLEFYCVWIK